MKAGRGLQPARLSPGRARAARSGRSGPGRWKGGPPRKPPPLTRRSGLSRGRRSSSGRVPGSGGFGGLRPPWPGPAASHCRVSGPHSPPAASCRRHCRGPWSRAALEGQGGAGQPGRPTDRRTDGPQRHRLPPALRRLGGAGQSGAPAFARPRGPRLQCACTRAARRSDACYCQ